MKRNESSPSTQGALTPIRIFCDGSGVRPDGTGSGFAWVRPETGQKNVQRVDGLTSNQAEYRALLSAIESLPDDAEGEIFTDSDLVACQFKGTYAVRDPKLRSLLIEIRGAIERKRLKITVGWVPREENPAGKLV
jgi:ribonuclease HI